MFGNFCFIQLLCLWIVKITQTSGTCRSTEYLSTNNLNIHGIHCCDILDGWDESAFMAVATVHFFAVLIGYDLRYGERHPHSVVEGSGGEYQAVVEALEAEGIFQVLVDIQQVAVEYHQVQLISRGIFRNKIIYDLETCPLVGDGLFEVCIYVIKKRQEESLGIGVA